MSEAPTIPTPEETAARRAELDRVLERLSEHKDRWVRESISARIRLLREAIDGVVEVADRWVLEASRARGIDPATPLSGEEWISGPMTTVRNLRLFVDALRHGGQPRPPALRTRDDGQAVARVFPRTPLDRFLYYNMSAEVWIRPGRPATQGRIYREKAAGRFAEGAVALVLGAGNISSIAPLDVVHKLFVEDQVVVLKMNPVNAYLGPFFERAFRGLIDRGYLAVVYGGAEVGEYLCRHERVQAVHLTGSDRTHDAIVWGSDLEEQAARKAEHRPLLNKPVTSELGCVTPILVTPGRWSAAALEFQARHVASMVTHNASFNCTAGKVLVLADGWDQRAEFLDRLRRALARAPSRRAYYPGATERYRTFLDRYPQAEPLGEEAPGVVPWTLIPDVPARRGEYALSREAFCGVLAQVTLEASNATAFLDRAVDFANEDVWGTLSCVLLVDPETERAHPAEVDRAVARLRYGSVGINLWSGVAFGLGVTAWGAYPGNTPEDIGSGTGFVHNAFFYDEPQKSIVRGPFRIWPKPVWFADHRTLDSLGRRLTRFEAHYSFWRLAAVAFTGIWG